MEELIAIVSVGAALAALIIAQGRSLRRDFSARMDRMEAQTAELRDHGKSQIGELREHGNSQIAELREHGNSQIAELRERGEAQSSELREHIDVRFGELRTQIGDLRERMAHLEGLLDGLREAIGRTRAA